jgi:acyl-CoA synthetase (AMP-forming)/AMP-acid ligase II
VLPFWLDGRYFFFVAFFAAFFAGAFLAAFFVAICLFSLVRWFASILQNNIAVEECIDSSNNSVKRKTTHRWKKWQQFFHVELKLACEVQIV